LIFTELAYLPLVVFSLIIFALLKNSQRGRLYLIIVASAVFYCWWSPKYYPLMFASIFLDYTVGIMLSKNNNTFFRKILLTFSICGNLGILALFKYSNFRLLRWLYEQLNIEEAREELKIWLAKWSKKYSKLCNWVEENIEETLTFYNFPKEHHRNLKSTNVLERLNEEIKRRTNVVRIFPNRESCLRLILALVVEIHEQWLESRYLNMDILREKKIEERIVVEEIAA